MDILVLCTDNASRSILLEAILNQDSAGRISAFSAGTTPAGGVHPHCMKLLDALGYPTTGLSSQSWHDYAGDDAPNMDIVITVCDNAAARPSPPWPLTSGRVPIQLHWGIPDPAATAKPDWSDAFQTAYASLSRKAQHLLGIPFESLTHEELKVALAALPSE